jgi:hypothetical protein
MTLDEYHLSKRLDFLSGDESDTIRAICALIGIDCSSWNLTWSELSTDLVSQFLDDIHGTDVKVI